MKLKIREDLDPREASRLRRLAGVPGGGEFRRQYKNLWQRAWRRDPEVRRRQAAADRARPQRTNAIRRWREKNKKYTAAYYRRYRLLFRARFCQACSRRSTRRNVIKPARSILVELNGNVVIRKTLLCRRCRQES